MATNWLNLLDIDYIKEHSYLAGKNGIPLINRFICLFAGDKSNILAMQVLNVDVSNISLRPVELELNGTRRFYFNGRDDNDLGITFLDTPDLKIRSYFFGLLQQSCNVNMNTGVKRQYMKNVINSYGGDISVFPLDNKGTPTNGDKFINCLPYDVSGVSYNYAEAGEVIKTTVKFKFMYHHITKWDNTDPIN